MESPGNLVDIRTHHV